MKTRSITLLLALAFALPVTGCSKSGTDPLTDLNANDQTQVTQILAANPVASTDDVFESTDPTALAPMGPNAPIQPMWFWRTFQSVERHFTFQFRNLDGNGRPQEVAVGVQKDLNGTLYVSEMTEGPPNPATAIQKPIHDDWTRALVLRRFDNGTARGVWRLVEASGVNVKSTTGSTRIQSVRIQWPGGDVTVRDPLTLWSVSNAPHFQPGDLVTLTVATDAANDVVLGYFRGQRERFQSMGDGTYSMTFSAGDQTGYRWFGVNALSHGTLYDDAASYDSHGWLLHGFVGDPASNEYYF